MSKKKVMLVLDDETGILGIFEELMGAEFEIHCCKNVTEAKNILKEHKPDIMFLDYLVDGEVGVSLIDEVQKENLKTNWAIMTSYRRMITESDLRKMDNCPIIEKPFKLELLKKTLSAILENNKKS